MELTIQQNIYDTDWFLHTSTAAKVLTAKKAKPLCSTLVIRPRLNSANGYFFPKSGLSYVFVYDLMIYDHFLSTLWVFCRKKF